MPEYNPPDERSARESAKELNKAAETRARDMERQYWDDLRTGRITEEEVRAEMTASEELRALELRLGLGCPSNDFPPRPQEDYPFGESSWGEGFGTAPVPRVPAPLHPTREGGAARTFEEAEEPPRNP